MSTRTNAVTFIRNRRMRTVQRDLPDGSRETVQEPVRTKYTDSPRNFNPTGLSEDTRMSSGLTAPGAWDSFFKRPGSPTGPSLAPQTAPNAPAMAQAFNFLDAKQEDAFSMLRPAQAPQGTVQPIAQTAFTSPAPTALPPTGGLPAGTAVSGTAIKTPYGTGSVLSGNDWMTKMKRLAQSGNMEWPTTI